MTMCIYITTTQSLEIVKKTSTFIIHYLIAQVSYQAHNDILMTLVMDLLEIITSICDGMEREIIKELDAEDLLHPIECDREARKCNALTLKSTLMLNHGIRRLFMVALGA
ncbi:hypothetical protein T4D_15975, partial [Trichinella pseudospiralis]